MSIVPKEVLKGINELRTNPKGFAEKVKKYIAYFEDTKLVIPEAGIKIRTNEGAKAFEEAVEFLNTLEPVCPISGSKGLTHIAEDFLEKVKGTDPSKFNEINMEEIISKYGEFSGNFSRAMEFGGSNSEQVIVNLIVSDGDPSRSQRRALLNPELRVFGVATSGHPTYRTGTIITGCHQFKSKDDPNDLEPVEGGMTEAFKPPEKPKATPPPKETPPPTKNDNVPINRPKCTVGEPKEEEPPKVETKPAPKPEPAPAAPVEEKLPDDAVSVEKKEKFIVEGGKRKKLITRIYKLKDGTERREEEKVKI